jgi:hypothetical protein
MRTTYIASDANTERKQQAAAATRSADAALGAADLDAQIAEIEVRLASPRKVACIMASMAVARRQLGDLSGACCAAGKL